MGKHFALALQLPSYRRERESVRARAKYKPALNSSRIGLVIAVVAAVAVLLYLFQVNSFSTKGYEINNLQTKISELKDQQRKLEIETAQLESIQRVQSDPSVVNMVPVQNVSYVQPSSSLSER